MQLFGFGRMTLRNATEDRIRKYCEQKEKQGFLCVEQGGVRAVVELLHEVPVYKQKEPSIKVDQKVRGDTIERTVSMFKEGDLETVLDKVFWDAGQARYQGVENFYVDRADDVGVKFHWGDDFIFVIAKVADNKFILYT